MAEDSKMISVYEKRLHIVLNTNIHNLHFNDNWFVLLPATFLIYEYQYNALCYYTCNIIGNFNTETLCKEYIFTHIMNQEVIICGNNAFLLSPCCDNKYIIHYIQEKTKCESLIYFTYAKKVDFTSLDKIYKLVQVSK